MTLPSSVLLQNAKSFRLCGSTKGHPLQSTLKAKSLRILMKLPAFSSSPLAGPAWSFAGIPSPRYRYTEAYLYLNPKCGGRNGTEASRAPV